jgi:hypothetical protein
MTFVPPVIVAVLQRLRGLEADLLLRGRGGV